LSPLHLVTSFAPDLLASADPFALAPWPVIAVRAVIVVAAVGAWWWTQALLARRTPSPGSTAPIYDGIHAATAKIHAYLWANTKVADRLLVGSSFVIDLLGLYLLLTGIVGGTFRPVVGLVVLFALRQACQLLCPLPPPEGMIWRQQKFPTLLVTYGCSSDLFFSGHTAIAIFGACMLASDMSTIAALGPAGLYVGLALGISIAAFEIGTVLLLRAHYTMDVFAGAVTALWIFSASATWAGWVDGWLARVG
jgi:hypothetical protein